MIGESLGHYLIAEKIGEGGMGVVYRATDQVLRRDVALKILPHAFADDVQRLRRFEHEARVLASLNHPNIAAIYDLLEAGDGHALVMELVDGPTLSDRIQEGPMQLRELLLVAQQLAEALAVAHEKGIVHRDLKPANVKLTGEGRVKILDFGLAKSLKPLAGTSVPEATTIKGPIDLPGISGTLPYMAPEQIRGERIDSRTDIYSLGTVLYEIAVGERPFGDSTGLRLVGDIQHRAPIPLRDVDPAIPKQLERIILKCLEKDPDKRYPSALELREALLRAREADKGQITLAVLYFENLGGDEHDDYFCDGITEDIIIELSKIRGLSVLSRSAVRPFRNSVGHVAQFGRSLDASHVLSGSIRRLGDRLRVTTQLIETDTNHAIWAERYDRHLEDVFAIQGEIAENIAGALQLVLTDQEKRSIEKVPTENIEAYQYYLRGRQHFQLFRRRSIEFAGEMFGLAIEIDPRYANAYAGLADCYSYLYMFWAATEENRQRADEASRRAIQLDPELAEAHVSRGVWASLSKRYEEASEAFETAIRLNPSLFEAYYFQARGYYAWGKLEDAVYWFRRACEVRPEDYQAPTLLGSALGGLGRSAESRAAFQMAWRRAQKHLLVQPGDTRAIYFSAIALCQLGERRNEALELAARALSMDPEEPQVLYNVGCIYALLGEKEKAFDCVTQVLTHGEWWRIWMSHDPDLVSLHDDPRFQELVGEL